MPTIESYIAREMITASPTETVADVAIRMRAAEVGATVIVENNSLVGVFTERDLLNRVVADGCDPALTPVGEVSTTVLQTVTPSSSIRECAEKLRDHHVRHLPVSKATSPWASSRHATSSWRSAPSSRD